MLSGNIPGSPGAGNSHLVSLERRADNFKGGRRSMEDLIRKKDAMKPLLLAYREIQRQARESEKEGDAAVSCIFGALSGVFKDQICWVMEAPARGADAGEILLDALEYYGERDQVDMIPEEMAELSKALLKLRRAQKFREPGQRLLMEDVAEEIADVQIVLDQMKLLFPGWETWMQKKLQRLEERIEKERTKGAVERRDAGDRAAAAGGDGPAVRRPPGDGGSGEAGPVQGESEAST